MTDTWKPGYRPSNGTDGDYFKIGPAGCHSCAVDHDGGWHTDTETDGDSCPILLAEITGDPAPEWERNTETGETRCTGWRGPCACTKGTTYLPPPADWPRSNRAEQDRLIADIKNPDSREAVREVIQLAQQHLATKADQCA